MLPHYPGKVEEYETWRFQLIQFLLQEPHFVEFLEWVENDLYSKDQHHIAIKKKNLEHEDALILGPTNIAREKKRHMRFE